MVKRIINTLLKIFKSKENLFFLIVALIFLSNAFHVQYPDEFDNLLGGKLILHGTLPFTGFMSHHGPFAYYLAAFLQLISGFSLVRFRIVYALFLVFLIRFVYIKLTRRFGDALFIKIFAIILGIILMYFWLYMLLGDTLSAFILVLPYSYLLMLDHREKPLSISDIKLINLFLFLSIFTSMSYVFFVIICYLYLAFLFIKNRALHNRQAIFKTIIALVTPYLFALIYFILTGSLKEYLFQNITYNKEYYISDYPRNASGQTIHPIRYAVYLAHHVLEPALAGVVDALKFNFYEPKTITLIGINTMLILYFLLNGKTIAGLFVFSMIVFTNTRASTFILEETDYQQAVYIVLSLVGGCYLFATSLKEKTKGYYQDFLIGAVLIANALYLTYFTSSLIYPYFNRLYLKFMGEMALVYDRPEMAPVLNQLLTKKDYAWIGPFYPEELYYLNAKLPSKYYWLLPASTKSTKIMQEMIGDFSENQPQIIIFNTGYGAFGQDPNSFNSEFVQFLDEHYTLLREIKDDNGKVLYECKVQTNLNFDCNSFFYVLNSQVDNTISTMLNKGMLERR